MAECHPVGFQWVMEAKAAGATVIHIDPRFTRTSAVADQYVPLRAGSDIAFLGAMINYILSTDSYFHEYVVAYTNAPTILREDFEDVDDLDGVFSGYDPETGTYDTSTWQYQGHPVSSSGGEDEKSAEGAGPTGAQHSQQERAAGHEMGGHGANLAHGEVERDETLQDPHCVFQVLKRHYARYTPEMVQRTCGVSPEDFLKVCESVVRNSGRERTTAWVYSVGWTHHTVGVQYIRGAAIIQLLLGNMGRPGGGILALRGHASIQGSTDIPTLFNLLPGYLPMPKVGEHDNLQDYVATIASPAQKGFWTLADAYTVSLLKSYWGDAATAENDFCFDYLPRLTGDHGTYQTVMDMLADKVEGYMLLGQNPAVGSAHGRMQRLAMSHLKYLVVRDLNMIESATFWKDSPEIETGELVTEKIATEVFFFPAASHVEKAGSFTQTQRLLQWRYKAVEPPGDCRSDLNFFFQLGRMISSDRRESRRDVEVLHRHESRRIHLRRLLDLYRGLRRQRESGGPAQAWQRRRSERPEMGLGLAGESAGALQPGVGRSAGPSVERPEGTGLVELRERELGRGRRAGLPGRIVAGPPTGAGHRWSGGAGRRRPLHHAGRRKRLAVRAERHARRAAAGALRTARVAGQQSVLPPAGEPDPPGVPSSGQSVQPVRGNAGR